MSLLMQEILTQLQCVSEQWELFKAENKDFRQRSKEAVHATDQDIVRTTEKKTEQESIDLPEKEVQRMEDRSMKLGFNVQSQKLPEKKKWMVVLSHVQSLKDQWDLFKVEYKDFRRVSKETWHAVCQNNGILETEVPEDKEEPQQSLHIQSQEPATGSRRKKKFAKRAKLPVSTFCRKRKRSAKKTFWKKIFNKKAAGRRWNNKKFAKRVKLPTPTFWRKRKGSPKKTFWEKILFKDEQKRFDIYNYLLMIQILKRRKKK